MKLCWVADCPWTQVVAHPVLTIWRVPRFVVDVQFVVGLDRVRSDFCAVIWDVNQKGEGVTRPRHIRI